MRRRGLRPDDMDGTRPATPPDNRPSLRPYEPLAREERRNKFIKFFTLLTGDKDFGQYYGGRLDNLVAYVDVAAPLRELYQRHIERDLPWNWWEDPFLILDAGGAKLVSRGGSKIIRKVLAAPERRSTSVLSIFEPRRDAAKRWREHAPPVEAVTGGVTGNGSPVITVTRTKRSLWGFTPESFRAVRERYVGQVRAAGYTDARVGIVGSAARGKSYPGKGGKPFHKDSDFDLAIISPSMLEMIQSRRDLAEIGIRHDSKASFEFADEKYLRALGLDGLIDEIKRLTGRKRVSIVVYRDEAALGDKIDDFFNFSLDWEGM